VDLLGHCPEPSEPLVNYLSAPFDQAVGDRQHGVAIRRVKRALSNQSGLPSSVGRTSQYVHEPVLLVGHHQGAKISGR
jgi:hypothetical protein